MYFNVVTPNRLILAVSAESQFQTGNHLNSSSVILDYCCPLITQLDHKCTL